MQSQDNTSNLDPQPPGGNGSHLPGFLAPKLAPMQAPAAPGSFADIQARLKAERRRRALWFWTLGLALLLAGSLLALRYTRLASEPAVPTISSQHRRPDVPPVASKPNAPAPAAKRTSTSIQSKASPAQQPSGAAIETVSEKRLPNDGTPYGQAMAAQSEPEPSQHAAVAVARRPTHARGIAPTHKLQDFALPARPEATSEAHNPPTERGTRLAVAPKPAAQELPAEQPLPQGQAPQPAPVAAPVSAKTAPALAVPATELTGAGTESTQQASAQPPAEVAPSVSPTPEPAAVAQALPLTPKAHASDTAAAMPATVTPTAPTPRPARWQFCLAAGAGIFNRQVLVPGAQRQEFEPAGLRSGLAAGARVSLGYRLAHKLGAELSLGLSQGQATLSRRRVSPTGGYTYTPIAGGFAAAPIAPTQIIDTPLDYTLATLQAGMAWQPSARWRARIRGGIQQTVVQQAPLAGTALPGITYPVGGAIMLRLAGPFWAGADVSYFGSGRGQSNSAALFLVEYQLGK